MERLTAPQGTFELERYPVRKNEMLRAWDAADEYLLRHVADAGIALDGKLLVVNDEFGALATALAAHAPISFGDSYLAHAATRANLERNGLDPSAVTAIPSLGALPERIEVVLLKIPKSTALLEEQLRRIAPTLHGGSVFVASAMAKHIHTSTLDAFERFIGPTRTSLAEKKARLVFSSPGATAPEPSTWPQIFTIPPENQEVVSHAGVFAAGRLDVGTRFYLETLKTTAAPETVVDLGCGNGILGMMTAMFNPEAEVTFVDESYLAVASAEATFRANLGPSRAAEFVVGNGLFDTADPADRIPVGSVDRVLCNPPFHANQAVGDATAWSMFADARDALRPGGSLWVIGNRHLAYHAKLKRLFGDCDVVNANSKFVVLRAMKG